MQTPNVSGALLPRSITQLGEAAMKRVSAGAFYCIGGSAFRPPNGGDGPPRSRISFEICRFSRLRPPSRWGQRCALEISKVDRRQCEAEAPVRRINRPRAGSGRGQRIRRCAVSGDGAIIEDHDVDHRRPQRQLFPRLAPRELDRLRSLLIAETELNGKIMPE